MEPQFINFDAIHFPADGRPPQVVQLMTSPASYTGQEGAATGGRVAHPEVHMEYIAENLGPRAWAYQLIEALDGMSKKFAHPYVIFYPVVSRDGMPFPVNKTVRDIQGNSFRQDQAWHGSLVIAKYLDTRYSQMTHASMADFPLIKNWLMHHGSPLPARQPEHSNRVV
ncbi:hypothetical protein PENSPDRAFT_129913 [Peniophora sp. CONT]|nr:hypothetical protein PENSPDRAFT_129913 [Peniophora sp. CONT]